MRLSGRSEGSYNRETVEANPVQFCWTEKMKRLRFNVRGMMIMVAIVAIGIYSRNVYKNYIWYCQMAALYKGFMAEDQSSIDTEKRPIAKRRELLKRLDHSIESFKKLQMDASQLRGERIYFDATLEIDEKAIANQKRHFAEAEIKYRRYRYLSSNPWLDEDPEPIEPEEETEESD